VTASYGSPPRRVIDTDVFSFIFQGRPLAAQYRRHLIDTTPVLCFQSVAELLQGAYAANWGSDALRRLRATIQLYEVAYVSDNAIEHFARIRAQRRREGRELKVGDAWIAATALWLGCPVVTHNARDFGGIPGLLVITEAGA
jgi:predicted nucleic acid-binding protein